MSAAMVSGGNMPPFDFMSSASDEAGESRVEDFNGNNYGDRRLQCTYQSPALNCNSQEDHGSFSDTTSDSSAASSDVEREETSAPKKVDESKNLKRKDSCETQSGHRKSLKTSEPPSHLGSGIDRGTRSLSRTSPTTINCPTPSLLQIGELYLRFFPKQCTSLEYAKSSDKVELVLLTTPDTMLSKFQARCTEVGATVSVVELKRDGTMREFLVSMLPHVRRAQENTDRMYYFCFTFPLYSANNIALQQFVNGVKSKCKNIRMLSTAATPPQTPLDGEIVTYITHKEDEVKPSASSGSFLFTEGPARKMALNCILGILMVKLACCGNLERFRKHGCAFLDLDAPFASC